MTNENEIPVEAAHEPIMTNTLPAEFSTAQVNNDSLANCCVHAISDTKDQKSSLYSYKIGILCFNEEVNKDMRAQLVALTTFQNQVIWKQVMP